MRGILVKFFRTLRDFLIPPSCPVCGDLFSGNYPLCFECVDTVASKCYNFSQPPRSIPFLDELSVLLPYDKDSRTLIHALKYHGIYDAGPFLGDLMGRQLVRFFPLKDNTLVIPIPLHPAKLMERGYNQSECLAAGLAVFTGLPLRTTLVRRNRNTPTQTALGAKEREENLRNAFYYCGSSALNGRHVILVDDVLTSGSTISECAKVLKEAGAGRIHAVVAATPSFGED